MLNIAGVGLDVKIDERWKTALRRRLPQRLRGGRTQQNSIGEPPRGQVLRRQLDASAFSSAERRTVDRINAIEWYHTIALPHGMVTPGLTDHRAQLASYGLPDDMHGLRALDIATFDGFWAFEMERRGSDVVAIDLPTVYDADIPLRVLEQMPADDNHATGAGFRLAHELLESNVERREMSVYDITPEAIGTFDVVFVSDLLLHLRDPQRALERAYSVVRDDGQMIVAEPYNPSLELLPDLAVQQLIGYDRYVWSIPSATMLRQMLKVAGFGDIDEVSRLQLNYRGTFPLEKIVFRAYPWQRRLVGSPHRNGATPAAAR
ncbi:MAG TPA: methyltransferase domain-containing protein [Dehalococcoidia bacterium]